MVLVQDPNNKRALCCRGEMGCRGPNDVTMGAQNNLQQQVRVAGVGVKSRGLKVVKEVQGLVQGPGCTRRFLDQQRKVCRGPDYPACTRGWEFNTKDNNLIRSSPPITSPTKHKYSEKLKKGVQGGKVLR